MANPTFLEVFGGSYNANDAGTLTLDKTKTDAAETLKELLDNVVDSISALDPSPVNTTVSKVETFGDVIDSTYTITFLSNPIVGDVIDEA